MAIKNIYISSGDSLRVHVCDENQPPTKVGFNKSYSSHVVNFGFYNSKNSSSIEVDKTCFRYSQQINFNNLNGERIGRLLFKPERQKNH